MAETKQTTIAEEVKRKGEEQQKQEEDVSSPVAIACIALVAVAFVLAIILIALAAVRYSRSQELNVNKLNQNGKDIHIPGTVTSSNLLIEEKGGQINENTQVNQFVSSLQPFVWYKMDAFLALPYTYYQFIPSSVYKKQNDPAWTFDTSSNIFQLPAGSYLVDYGVSTGQIYVSKSSCVQSAVLWKTNSETSYTSVIPQLKSYNNSMAWNFVQNFTLSEAGTMYANIFLPLANTPCPSSQVPPNPCLQVEGVYLRIWQLSTPLPVASF